MENPGASRMAIESHYDVSNDFYRLWLDPSLVYSAAMWQGDDTLDSAQQRKIDYHIAQSGAARAKRVLDVGCGWGAVLKRLVTVHGVETAVGLTLSRAQARWVEELQCPGVDVRVESWADHESRDRYDAIISIGAFEHFAKISHSDQEKVEGYRAFFECCHRWLKPGGRMSLQTFAYGSAINRDQARTSRGTLFLADEIFPETDPPRLADIANAVVGTFEIESLRNDHEDYERTCRLWLQRLRQKRDDAIQLVGDAVVSRYERYLQLSTLGFKTQRLALYRLTLSRMGVR
jgi:cyclopropane-fatty-acyl-phospholipid synthase